jgi:hypothetical protein
MFVWACVFGRQNKKFGHQNPPKKVPKMTAKNEGGTHDSVGQTIGGGWHAGRPHENTLSATQLIGGCVFETKTSAENLGGPFLQ